MTGDQPDSDDEVTGDATGRDTSAAFDRLPTPAVRYAVRDGISEIRAVNAAFAETFGVEAADVIGDELAAYVRADGIERLLTPDDASPTDDSSAPVEDTDPEMSGRTALATLHSAPAARVIVRHELDGEPRYFQVRTVAHVGEADHRDLIYSDVTALQRTASEWEQTATRLERFAAVAVHDIQNPLEVARIRLEAARDTQEGVHFEKVAGALDRIEAIVEDVLSVGRTSLEASETVAVDDCAGAAWDTVDTAGASLSASTPLPTIRADRSRLRQLFENLIRNAVEHRSGPGAQAREDAVERGGRDTTVTVGPLSDGFYVADDGPGIPESDRERVFEAGYSTKADDAGLGLAIVEQIAAAHGWQVTLTTADSGGARFEFTGVEEADADAGQSR